MNILEMLIFKNSNKTFEKKNYFRLNFTKNQVMKIFLIVFFENLNRKILQKSFFKDLFIVIFCIVKIEIKLHLILKKNNFFAIFGKRKEKISREIKKNYKNLAN